MSQKLTVLILAVACFLAWVGWLLGDDAEQLRPHIVQGNELIESHCTASPSSPSCASYSDIGHLASKGFTVFPGFLSKGEVNEISMLYYSKGWANNGNYGTKMVDESEISPSIYRKLHKVVHEISSQTNLRVDMLMPRSLFFIVNSSDHAHSIGIPWHQDTESFLLGENHYDYVNLYMPIKKTGTQDANLQLVPFDTLLACSSALHNLSYGKGAADFVDCQGQSPRECQMNVYSRGQQMSDRSLHGLPSNVTMLRIDNNHAAVHALNFHLDSLACSPELQSGDLLAFRGDMLHKTGKFQGPRLAWSVRVVSSTGTVSLERLLTGGINKLVTINSNIGSYTARMGVIRAMGLTEMSYLDLSLSRGCAKPGGNCSLSPSEWMLSQFWGFWYSIVFRLRLRRYEFLTGTPLTI